MKVKFLVERLQSILEQHGPEIEVVVDDGEDGYRFPESVGTVEIPGGYVAVSIE